MNVAARWTAAFALVVAIHFAAYLALQATMAAAPMRFEAPIMMDLAQAPPAAPPEPVPAPPLPQPDAQPPEPPPPSRSLAPVALPEPPPPPPPPVRQVQRPVKRDTPPVPTPVRSAEPAPSEAAVPTAPAITPQQVTWQSRLASHLARFKRYPPAAQARNEQGIVLMRLVVTRDGSVVSAAVVRGSGIDDLDRAAGEWVARASPVPAFPEDMPQARIEVTVPFRFTLR